MPREKRAKSIHTPATDPTPIAAVLEQSPAMEVIRASREAKPQEDPERPMPAEAAIAAFQKRRDREQAVAGRPGPVQPRSHVERLVGQTTGMRPVPSGFKDLFSFPAAGIRVNRPLDRKVLAIQCAEDRRASRDGLNSKVETLPIEGYRHQPLRRQWMREDRELPGARIADEKRPGPSWPGLGRAERYELGTPRQGHRDRRPGVRFPGMSPVHRHAHGRAYPGPRAPSPHCRIRAA
jgi:hypothetical protein